MASVRARQLKRRKHRLAEAIMAADRSLALARKSALPRSDRALSVIAHCEYILHFHCVPDAGLLPRPRLIRDLQALVRELKRSPAALGAAWEVVIVHEVMEM